MANEERNPDVALQAGGITKDGKQFHNVVQLREVPPEVEPKPKSELPIHGELRSTRDELYIIRPAR